MKLTPFVMKEKSSIDIDTKFDYEITKLLLNKISNNIQTEKIGDGKKFIWEILG